VQEESARKDGDMRNAMVMMIPRYVYCLLRHYANMAPPHVIRALMIFDAYVDYRRDMPLPATSPRSRRLAPAGSGARRTVVCERRAAVLQTMFDMKDLLTAQDRCYITHGDMLHAADEARAER